MPVESDMVPLAGTRVPEVGVGKQDAHTLRKCTRTVGKGMRAVEERARTRVMSVWRALACVGVRLAERGLAQIGHRPNRPTRSERTLGVLERFGTLRQRRAAVRDESKRHGKWPKGT